LDGTLLDTLDDLAAATNATLAAYGFPVRTREEVRLFVGNGVEKLMERALPDGHATVAHLPDGSSADFGALLADFKSRYAACCEDRTRPYPGIPALLAVLCVAPAWATALLLAALTLIFNDTVIPRITQEIEGLFGAAN
jgi:phosphoglycolate phosphatase